MEHLYYYKAKPRAVGVTSLTQKKLDRPLKQEKSIAAGKLIFKVEMGIVVKRTKIKKVKNRRDDPTSTFRRKYHSLLHVQG